MVVAVKSVIAGEVADDVKDKLRVDGGSRNKDDGSEEEGGLEENFAVPPYSSLGGRRRVSTCVVRQLDGAE